jgi:hypothetical protein
VRRGLAPCLRVLLPPRSVIGRCPSLSSRATGPPVSVPRRPLSQRSLGASGGTGDAATLLALMALFAPGSSFTAGRAKPLSHKGVRAGRDPYSAYGAYGTGVLEAAATLPRLFPLPRRVSRVRPRPFPVFPAGDRGPLRSWWKTELPRARPRDPSAFAGQVVAASLGVRCQPPHSKNRPRETSPLLQCLALALRGTCFLCTGMMRPLAKMEVPTAQELAL